MAFETGAISFSALQSYFGGSNPVSLSEYYRGGANVPTTKTVITTYNSGTLGSNFGSGRPQDQYGWFAGTSATFPGGTPTGGEQVWIVIGSDAGTPFSNMPSLNTVGSNVSVSGGSSSTTGSTEAKVWTDINGSSGRLIVIINHLNNATDVTSFSMTSSNVTWTFSYVGTDFGKITAPNIISPVNNTISIGVGSTYNNWTAYSFSYARDTSSTATANTGIPSSGTLSAEDFRGADAP